MKSLLQAAERIREDRVSLPPAEKGDNVISSEEQQDIMQEIDRLSAQSRINVTPDLFKISALKNGVIFPLLVNLVALVILGGGIFATKYYFDRKDEHMILASAEQQSAEGNLIKEIKKETEQRLAEKESEIQSIQENMKQIESERIALEENMNSKITEREVQLQAEMEALLAAEREKLQSQGMSVQQIDERIEQLKLEQSSIFDQELTKYREEARIEKIELEESLNQLQNEYNSKLTTVNEERARIEEEARSREEELTARMEARTRELETEMSEAQRELEALAETREQENLVENQIIGFYKNIEKLMNVGQLELASVELKNLRNYLYDDSVITLDGITRRREIDLFVIDSLSKLIETARTDPIEELDTMSLIDAAERLEDIRQTVVNADQQLAVGNREMAELMYRNALEQIPEINRSHQFFLDTMERELELGYEELDQIQKKLEELLQDRTRREEDVQSLLAEANASYQQGRYNQAVESFQKAFTATGFDNLDEASSRMVASGRSVAIAPFKEQVDNLTEKNLELEEKLTGSDESLSSLSSDLALKDEEISRLNEALVALNEQLEIRDSELSKYNQQLEGRSGDLASLNEELDTSISQISSLSDELDSSLNQVSSLSTELESSRSEISTLSDRLAEEQNQVVSLREKITTYEERIEDMRLQLEEEKSRVVTDQEDNKLIDREIAELTTLKAQLNRLNKSYTDFELVADNLEDNLQGDAATIEALYDFFNEDSVEDVMPGIGEYLRSFSSVYISAGQEIGLYEAVSLLYDLNNITSNSARIDFLEDKKSEYSGNEAMIEIITQLQQSF